MRAHPRRAQLPRRRDPLLRVVPLGRHDAAVEGRRDHRRGRRDGRSDRARHRPVLRRCHVVAGARAEVRRRRRRRDRQLVGVADGSRRAADRQRGQPAPRSANARKGIIANPNCTTMAAMPVLKPLHDEAGLVRLVAATYQACQRRRARRRRRARQAGPRGRSTGPRADPRRRRGGDSRRRRSSPGRSRSTCCPFAGKLVDDGSFETDEEQKLRNESRKILDIPEPAVSAARACACRCSPATR